MKRTLFIASLVLGISSVSLSQTAALSTSNLPRPVEPYVVRTVVVTGKMQVSSTEHVYIFTDIQTGIPYESLPTKAQIVIGEHTAAEIVIELVDWNEKEPEDVG